MTQLEAIHARHSVRAYESRTIAPETLTALHSYIAQCNEEGGLHLQLLEDAGNTFRRVLSRVMGLGSAPSVIACVGPKTPGVEERIGYYGQKVVLYAQTLGLNTCWAGTFNAKQVPAVIGEGEQLVIVIAIGYGSTDGKPRKSRTADQVMRIDAKDVSAAPEWFMKGIELALLAPTAINQQHFLFALQDGGKVTVEDKGGIFSKVDKGIAACHFEIGSGVKPEGI